MGLGRGGRSPSSEGFSLPSPISKSFPFLQTSQLLAGGAGGTDIGHGLDLNLTARVGERKLGAVLQRAVHADKAADKAFGRKTFRLFGAGDARDHAVDAPDGHVRHAGEHVADDLTIQQDLRMRVVIGRRHLAGVKAAVGVGIRDIAGSKR